MAPGIAQAHHTAVPIVALDYRNDVLPSAVTSLGVRASAEDAGRKLRLTTTRPITVVVLGYVGEPFLRFNASGVAANARSETAQGLRLVKSATVSGSPADASWTRISRGDSFAWADARSWAPSSVLRNRAVVPWRVPLIVGRRRTSIKGELSRVARPPLWPWIVLALLPLIAAAIAVRQNRRLWTAICVLAAVAGIGTIADLSGFAAAGLAVSTDRWFLFAVEIGLTIAAVAVLPRADARLIAVVALAPFAVLQALSELSIFRHGLVVSALPATIVRTAAALALGAGLAAGVLVFLAPEPTAERPRKRSRRNTSSFPQKSRKEQA